MPADLDDRNDRGVDHPPGGDLAENEGARVRSSQSFSDVAETGAGIFRISTSNFKSIRRALEKARSLPAYRMLSVRRCHGNHL